MDLLTHAFAQPATKKQLLPRLIHYTKVKFQQIASGALLETLFSQTPLYSSIAYFGTREGSIPSVGTRTHSEFLK